MTSPTNLGNLNTSDWARLQDLAERLEASWREKGPVDLNLLLPPPGDGARLPSLVELIKTDLEIRWRRGQGVRLDWYVERFEELGSVSELSPRLIYEEYRVRQLHGDKPDLSSYKRRFPRQYPEVEGLVMAEPIGTVSPALATSVDPPPSKPPSSTRQDTGGTSREYHPIERIGTGSFGEVWRAEAPGGIKVALKIIYRPIGSDADQHEKKALDRIKNLRHPFLLATHAYWISTDGRLHIAMELADGTLRDRLKECLARGLAGIPPDELLGLMRQAAQSLDYVHGTGLYHRDIKPDNILLSTGFAKVGDFSLVRNQETLSIDSAAAGTLAYMGPECYRGNVGKQSDQYSLAITYFELRSNRRPYPTRTNWYDAMIDAVEGTPDLTPLEGMERDAVLKALGKKPEERFPTCLAFVEALESAIKGEPAAPRSAAQESWLQPMRRVGPDGYQLLHRLSGASAVGQFWEAVAPGGKHVALQVIENLDRGGVLEHLRAYDLARCFAGAANVLQVHENWLVNAAGKARSLADVLKAESEERVALVVVQELADDDLARRMGGSRRKLSDERLGQLLAYLKQAALALDHVNARAHTYARRQVAIRHCAIRPENLLLIGDVVRVAHFDLAQEATEPSEPLRADSLDLEPGYAAPELLERGGGRVTETSDQYSLAMSYVKLRTGSLPFDQSQSRNRIIDEQLDGKLNLKSLPEPERAVIAKGTARRPEDRYPSCAALIEALEAVCRVVSVAEIVIDSPSVLAETLEKKPATQHPVQDRPTPARGNWRAQGVGKAPATDQTLLPGQEVTGAESFCDIHVPLETEAKREAPRPKPRLKAAKQAHSLRAISVAVTLTAMLVALIAWKLWRPSPQDPPLIGRVELVALEPMAVQAGNSKTLRLNLKRVQYDGAIQLMATANREGITVEQAECPQGSDIANLTLTVKADVKADSASLSVRATAEGLEPSEKTWTVAIEPYEPPPLGPVAAALKKFDRQLHAANWQTARDELRKLSAAFLLHPDEARQQVEYSLQVAAKKVKDEYRKTTLVASDVHEWAEAYKKFPIRSFDLTWVDCKAYADEGFYEQFLIELPTLKDAAKEGNHDSEIEDLFAGVAKLTAGNRAELVKLLDALPKRRASQGFEKDVEALLVKSINQLTEMSFAGLDKPGDFAEILKYTAGVNQELASDKTLACHVESLLRCSGNSLPAKGSEACNEAHIVAARAKMAQSQDPYVIYARGLAAQAKAEWSRAADAYDAASMNDDLGWSNSARRAFAVDAYYNAAKEAWTPGKDLATAASAVKRYKAAVGLAAPMPLQHLLGFLEAAHAAEDWKELELALGDLARRKEFKSLPTDLFSLEALGKISRIFVAWAEGKGHEAKAQKLLDKIGPALQAVEKPTPNGEPFDYWVGKYYWELRSNPAKRAAALKAFGRSLAQSKSTGNVYALGLRWKDVEDLLNPIQDTDTPEDWEKVFEAAIDANPKSRTERQWELMLKKCMLAAFNKKRTDKLVDDLRQAKNPALIRDVEELIASKTDRVDLQIEAGLVLWAALANSFIPAYEKGMTQEHLKDYIRWTKESSRRLASQLATKGVFEKWPRSDKAEATRNFAKKFGELPDRLHVPETEAKEFRDGAADILKNLDEYEQKHAKPERG